MENKNIVISTSTILTGILIVFGILIGSATIYYLQSVLLYFFIATIIALALDPYVTLLRNYKIPRSVAVGIVITTVLLVIFGVGSIALVPLSSEIQSLVVNFPYYLDSVLKYIGFVDPSQVTGSMLTQLSQTTGTVIVATIGVFSSFFSVLVTMVFAVYILIDFKKLRLKFIHLFPKQHHKDIHDTLSVIETKLGGWLRGQIVLMLIIGSATFIGLFALNMPYALALALIAGLLEIVPVIGPLISAIPAIIVGFTVDPLTGLGVTLLYIVIQQVENNFIVPKIMQRAVGFNPLVSIVALMIGSQLLGVVGAIIALPVAIILFELYRYIMKMHFNYDPEPASTQLPDTAG